MPELMVVREFKRRCTYAMGNQSHPCTLYFNKKAMMAARKVEIGTEDGEGIGFRYYLLNEGRVLTL
jgi:hypothetical protein